MERSSAETEDEYVALPCRLLVQTRGNGGGGRLVDDTENVETAIVPASRDHLSLTRVRGSDDLTTRKRQQ